MARTHPHKRAARAATICILTFIATLAVIWLAPRASDAVTAWLRTPDVRTRTIALSADLPVAAAARTRRRGRAHRRTGRDGRRGCGDHRSGPALQPRGRHLPPARAGRRRAGAGPHQPRRQIMGRVVLCRARGGGRGRRLAAAGLHRAAVDRRRPLRPGRGAAGPGQQAAPPALRGVKVVALNSSEDADAGATLLGVVRRTAAAVAGLQLAPPVGAMTTKPPIVTRAEWGADESYRAGSPSFGPVKMVFVHHTASGNDYTRAEAPAIVRAVYAYHTRSLHWSDVGYNFLVDRYGTVYEGRYGGVSKGAIGAQTLGFNTGSIGVSVIGDFTKAAPPGGGRERARASSGLEAGRPSRRSTRQGDAGVRLRREVRHRPGRGVPRHRRSPRRELHRVPGQDLRAAAGDPPGRRRHGPAQDLRIRPCRRLLQPQRRRRARQGARWVSPSRRPPAGASRSASRAASSCAA